jgi:flagellar biosynthesis GTPase FlhF
MKEEMTGLVIRVFCETGIKQLFLKLRGLLMRHQNKAETVQLRNKWVDINPGNWIERANTTTVVGLGTGDRLKKAAGLREILAYQKELAAGGFMGPLVSSERIGHTLKELIRVQGLGDPDDFLLDPAQLTKENPAFISPRGQEAIRAMQQQKQQAEQAAQVEQQKAQAQQQAQMALVQVQVEMENIKAQAKLMEAQIRKQTADEDRMAEMMQAMKELEFKYSELAATVSTEQAKTSAKAGTDIMQAGIQLEIAEKQSQVAKETAKQKPTSK